MMSHAHTHTHVPRTLGACDLTHMRVAYAQNPGSMFAHAHMCVAEARKPWGRGHTSGCLVAHAAFALMFECVTSQRCVLPTRADMCVAEGGAVMTWLHVVSSHASPHTHTRTRAHVCGASREPRPWSLTCAHTHTHACCRRRESVVTLPVACSGCTCTQPPVCGRSKGLRPRRRRRCFCDVRTFVVAQRCVSGSMPRTHMCVSARSPGSRFRFVAFVSGVC